MTFFDLCVGTRMHVAFMVFCGILDDFVFGFCDFLMILILTMIFLLDLYDIFCYGNRLFYLRLRGLSYFDVFDLCFMSLSGVISRSLGLV